MPTNIPISQEWQEYEEENYNFSFSYPKSFNFERQNTYPGGTIKEIGFRVDGLTESQMVSKELEVSLKSNDLYCNLDESFGEAVCSNINVEVFTNSKGVSGYLINREKNFYDDETSEPTLFKDIVYAFPIRENNKSISSYKAIIFSIKYPSAENLELLRQIVDTVKVN